jgi:hypothetical protein
VPCRDLAETIVVPGEERRTDPAATVLGIEETDLLVEARAIDLLIPPDAAIADGPTVDLGDEQVAFGVAALQVGVPGCNAFRGVDAVLPLALRPRRDDPRKVRIVGRAPERPEQSVLELRNLRHSAHSCR